MNIEVNKSPGSDPGQLTLPGGAWEACVAAVHWPAKSPGEDSFPEDSFWCKTLPGKAQDHHGVRQEEQRWHRATTTRGRSSLFLHYPDQAFNASDDDATPSKSIACQVHPGSRRCLRCEGKPG